MNWDAIGACAELVGALGVIASLVYLARQIHQSNVTDRLSATIALHGAYNQAVILWFGNPENAKIARTGLTGLENLTEDQRLQFSAQLATLYFQVETVFSQHRRGLVDPDLWNRTAGLLLFYRGFPGVKQWWEGTDLLVPGETFAAREQFSPEFREFAEAPTDVIRSAA